MPLADSDRGPGATIAGLLRDLRSGAAGFATRLGLSLAAATASVGTLMVFLGLADTTAHRVRDGHVAVGMLLVLLIWVGFLFPIWGSYSRKRHIVRTVLTCLVIVIIAVCVSALFGVSMRSPEFFIAATLFLGAAALVAVITATIHRASRGRAIAGTDGAVAIHCPACGYSMSGLDTTTCPECGLHTTLDALIRAQDYDALRPRLAGAKPDAPLSPVQLPTALPPLPSTSRA